MRGVAAAGADHPRRPSAKARLYGLRLPQVHESSKNRLAGVRYIHPTDVQDWFGVYRRRSHIRTAQRIPVNGGDFAGTKRAGGSARLDTVMEIAPLPGNTYVVYDAPSGTNFQDHVHKMVDDGDTVISNSWTQCETRLAGRRTKRRYYSSECSVADQRDQRQWRYRQYLLDGRPAQ